MSDWKTCALNEVCDMVPGFAFKSNDFGNHRNKVIKIKDICPPNIDITNADGVSIKNYDKKKLEKYLIKSGDYVLAMTGATIGKIGRLQSGEAYLNQRVLLFKEKEHVIDKDYLYYALNQSDFFPFILNHIDSHTAQANISAATIGQYTISLPPLSEQVEIGRTLRALDDKIAVNDEINHHLEQIARAIFIEYQANGKGSICRLNDITLINPESYSGKEQWGFINYLDTGNITQGEIFAIDRIDLEKDTLPSRAKRKVIANDIVYSTVRPNQRHYGLIATPEKNMLVSTGFTVIRSNCPHVCNEYIYLMLTMEPVIERLQQLAEQSVSTFPSIKPTEIGMLDIKVPTATEGRCLEEKLRPLFECMANNRSESIRLASLRNTLLPRLMSDELSFANL